MDRLSEFLCCELLRIAEAPAQVSVLCYELLGIAEPPAQVAEPREVVQTHHIHGDRYDLLNAGVHLKHSREEWLRRKPKRSFRSCIGPCSESLYFANGRQVLIWSIEGRRWSFTSQPPLAANLEEDCVVGTHFLNSQINVSVYQRAKNLLSKEPFALSNLIAISIYSQAELLRVALFFGGYSLNLIVVDLLPCWLLWACNT